MRMRKGLANRAWESLVLAIVGEQFDVGNDICGAVVSVRYRQVKASQPRVPEEVDGLLQKALSQFITIRLVT